MDSSGLGKNSDWIQVVPVRTPTLPPATHTNCYLIGQSDWIVVDPGSPYPEENEKLLAQIHARATPPQAIFLTHHHVDHVSGVTALVATLGLPVWCHPRTTQKIAPRIVVQRQIEDQETLQLGERQMQAIYTPGHAPGHLCLWEKTSRTLVCGDMVASVGTIIVEPDDDGDMADYLASLAVLQKLDASCLLPAHGAAITTPDQKLSEYIAHRLARESRVISSLHMQPQTLAALVPAVYADVDPMLYPLAKKSLLAHLLKLQKEGRATDNAAGWRLA